jgi:TIR domain
MCIGCERGITPSTLCSSDEANTIDAMLTPWRYSASLDSHGQLRTTFHRDQSGILSCLGAPAPSLAFGDGTNGSNLTTAEGQYGSWEVMVRAWDVFISHAGDDKDAVAIPLAKVLRRAGLRVWLDRQELRIGDSLHEKIDEGLANSRFGIVILSPSFLAKRFPRKELDGLFAREDAWEHKVILPIWHQIDKTTLAKYSPILADRLAGNTAEGIPSVATQIIDVVTDPGSGAPSDIAPTPLRLLIDLLDRQPARSDVVEFLTLYPRIVHRALGSERGSERWSTQIGSVMIDLCASRRQYTTGQVDWHLVQFQPPAEPVLIGSGPSPSLNARVIELRDLRRWIGRNLREARESLPGITITFQGIVVAGRRQQLSQDEVESLQRYNEELSGIRVRTYDWIIDIAAEQV